MADVENQKESSFPVKRKSDLCCQEEDHGENKAQKLNPSSSSADSESKEGEINGSGVDNLNPSIENGVAGDLVAEEKQEGGDGEEEEDEDDDEEDEEEEVVDRKGKGISREDKGKGKMIEVDESSEDSDDDEDGDEYDESDLSDDPLAEVDLDNILPSRTRRRSFQPGVYISNDRGGGNNNEGDDDSSDDSDA